MMNEINKIPKMAESHIYVSPTATPWENKYVSPMVTPWENK